MSQKSLTYPPPPWEANFEASWNMWESAHPETGAFLAQSDAVAKTAIFSHVLHILGVARKPLFWGFFAKF